MLPCRIVGPPERSARRILLALFFGFSWVLLWLALSIGAVILPVIGSFAAWHNARKAFRKEKKVHCLSCSRHTRLDPAGSTPCWRPTQRASQAVKRWSRLLSGFGTCPR